MNDAKDEFLSLWFMCYIKPDKDDGNVILKKALHP